MQADVLKNLTCELGEGPLWDGTHLWFFDILAPMMYRITADGATLESWEGERMASAIARTTNHRMLVATETDLMLFDPVEQSGETLVELEADNPDTRSNDGRADRQGGFWIGTMSKEAAPEAGALYRFYKGELRCLRKGMTIPNSICFSPDGRYAYFSDSWQQQIYRWMLGPDGWPIGAPEHFYRVEGGDTGPDGAIVDDSGALWVAMWGEGLVLKLSPNGAPEGQLSLPVSQASCPALTEQGRMFVTTARQGMRIDEIELQPLAGSLFYADLPIRGLPEPQVIL